MDPENLQPLSEFGSWNVENDAQVKEILGPKNDAFVHIDSPGHRIKWFKELVHDGKYRLYSRYANSWHNEERWHQVEDQAMELEVGRTVRRLLAHYFCKVGVVEEMQTDIPGRDNQQAQEWDAVFKVSSTLYLCEAKHLMSVAHVDKLSLRLAAFRVMQRTTLKGSVFADGIDTVVGVACGTHFPELALEEAKRLGILCVYPSGDRYFVDGTPISETDSPI